MINDLQCPVCGYAPLDEPPFSQFGGASYVICDCCNFQFGFDDDDQGFTFEQWRDRWIAGGMLWGGNGEEQPPDGWDPEAQLRTLTQA